MPMRRSRRTWLDRQERPLVIRRKIVIGSAHGHGFQRPLRAAAASATCNTSGRLRVRRLTACAASPRCDSGLEVQMFQASRLKAANSRSLIATPFITLPAAEGNQKRQAYRVCLRTTSCLLLCAGRPDRSWLLLAAGATVGTDGGGVADLRHGGGGQSNDGPPRRQPTSTPEPLTADPDLIALQARFYKSGAKFKGFSGAGRQRQNRGALLRGPTRTTYAAPPPGLRRPRAPAAPQCFDFRFELP